MKNEEPIRWLADTFSIFIEDTSRRHQEGVQWTITESIASVRLIFQWMLPS